MTTYTNVIAATVGATILAFALSTFGLWPTSRIYEQPRGPLRILHLLSLQLIIALIYAYVNCFLPYRNERNQIALTICCSMVGAFWWLKVARRTTLVRDPIEVSIYITSTVLFAYVCPMMILLNAIPLFERVHPTMSAAPIVFVFLLHLSLYFLVFWTTNQFIAMAETEVRSGKPSDASKDGAARFDDGNSTPGPR